MKKLLILMLVFMLSLGLLVSCGGGETPPVDDDGGNEGEDGTEGTADSKVIDVGAHEYALVYSTSSMSYINDARDFADLIEEQTGIKLDKEKVTAKEVEYEILFGLVKPREACADVHEVLDRYTNADLEAYAVCVAGNKIVVTATEDGGMQYAKETLLSYVKDGKLLIPKDLNLMYVYNPSSSVHTAYAVSELEGMAELSAIIVEGRYVDLTSGVYNYVAGYSSTGDYPMLTANTIGGATLSITQAKDNGGTAKIEVTSKDGKKNNTFNVKFEYGSNIAINAEVVNKGGAGGVVTFVIDDGNQYTADALATNILPKYPDLHITFGIITEKLATLELTSDSMDWLKDGSGRYSYYPVKNKYNSTLQGSVYNSQDFEYVYEFWNDILEKFPGAELASHSHTHKEWGLSDNALIENGMITYPNNNITKELAASVQILRELCGENAYTYIRPGVGTCTGTEATYYYDLLVNSGIYVGARASKTMPWNLSGMVNHANVLTDIARRYEIMSYAIEHYNGAITTDGKYVLSEGASREECIAVGVPVWKAYIDQAIEDGGWAAYCIHDIVAKDANFTGISVKHHTYEEQIDEMFAHAQQLSDEGKLWIANFTEASLYYSEWSTAVVNAVVNGEENVKVSITDSENDATHNMPLTVKVSVPRSWTTAHDGTSELEIHTDDNGNKFVYVDVVPDTGAVTVTQAIA